MVLGLQIVDSDPGSLLSVRLDGHGWAVTTTIEQVIKSRLDDPVGVISPDEQQAVDNALRAALDLYNQRHLTQTGRTGTGVVLRSSALRV